MIGIRKLALAAVLATSTAVTFAGAARAGEVGGRLHNQRDRIEQGYENGSLNHKEACRLLGQEKDMRQERRHMARNGLSERERESMNRDLDRESRRIHEQRTDDEGARKGRNFRNLDC
jgi:hypothetical protein